MTDKGPARPLEDQIRPKRLNHYGWPDLLRLYSTDPIVDAAIRLHTELPLTPPLKKP